VEVKHHLIDYIQKKGLQNITGYILGNNRKMLRLVKQLGVHTNTL